MVYLYIIILIGIAFLILERKRFFGRTKSEDSNNFGNSQMGYKDSVNQNNISDSSPSLKPSSSESKKGFFSNGIWGGNFFERNEFKDSSDFVHIPCEKCGTYISQDDAVKKGDKYFCKECEKKV